MFWHCLSATLHNYMEFRWSSVLCKTHREQRVKWRLSARTHMLASARISSECGWNIHQTRSPLPFSTHCFFRKPDDLKITQQAVQWKKGRRFKSHLGHFLWPLSLCPWLGHSSSGCPVVALYTPSPLARRVTWELAIHKENNLIAPAQRGKQRWVRFRRRVQREK